MKSLTTILTVLVLSVGIMPTRANTGTGAGAEAFVTTLYYVDGGEVKLTHYCIAGNQPTMRGTYAPETKTITFDLVSISNLKNPGDGHMHHAVYTFIDDDHLKTAWTFQKGQKDAFTEDATYVRAK